MSYNRIIFERKIKEFLEEDSNFKDVSSQFIPPEAITSAKIKAKSNGYVSGLEEIEILFNYLNVQIECKKKDGDAVKKGEILAELKGNVRNILRGERVGLNILMHMSAITSTTRTYIEKIKESGAKIKIACTRKTIPGIRIFEKKAVELGGGDPHRFSLDDMILLKDTHLKYYNGDILKLLSDVKEKASFSKKVEIEIEKVEDVIIAAQNGADIIMLDNMTPQQVTEAIRLLKKNSLRDKVITEVSGNVTLENFADYLKTEVDIISTSELTQFPSKSLDVSLRFD